MPLLRQILELHKHLNLSIFYYTSTSMTSQYPRIGILGFGLKVAGTFGIVPGCWPPVLYKAQLEVPVTVQDVGVLAVESVMSSKSE